MVQPAIHRPPRHLTFLCRIVDNLGDAGVALRLARQWLHKFPLDRITLCTDDIAPFCRLAGSNPQQAPALPPGLELVESLNPSAPFNWGDTIIELFGTPLHADWKQLLGKREQRPVWVNLEYLSAESWVSGVHGLSSIDPQTGWTQHFFYPGFDETTGGLLGPEPETPETSPPPIAPLQSTQTGQLNAYVFAYSLDALCAVIGGTRSNQTATPLRFYLASASNQLTQHPDITPVDFVPQNRFDALLAQFDLLFVRGEDSFVRAQLSGKPMVWQIYPTEDGAHWQKLGAFFERYTGGLNAQATRALRRLWWLWNGDRTDWHAAGEVLDGVIDHWPDLQQNAARWLAQIVSHCNLVDQLDMMIESRRT